MSPDDRCQARSRLSGGQCILQAGHLGKHTVSRSEGSHFQDLDQMWSEPSTNPPVSLEEMIAHLHDLIMYARAEGFDRMADLLTVARARMQLNSAVYERGSTLPKDLPPLE